MFGVVSLTMGNSAFPFAHSLIGDVKHLGQLLLGHVLTPAIFGDKRAELFFVQSDHLAVYCSRWSKKSNRPAV